MHICKHAKGGLSRTPFQKRLRSVALPEKLRELKCVSLLEMANLKHNIKRIGSPNGMGEVTRPKLSVLSCRDNLPIKKRGSYRLTALSTVQIHFQFKQITE